MNKILSLKQNTKGIDWFVGDLHGMFNLLEEQLSAIKFNVSTDRLFCTGDLVDRGSESHRSIEFLKKDWFYSVKGNHDNFVLGEVDSIEHKRLWFGNGGYWWYTLKDDEIKRQFIELFSQLPLIIEVETKLGKIGIVHAEVPEKFDDWEVLKNNIDDENTQDTLIWGRKRIHTELKSIVKNIDLVVSGHTMLVDPVRLGNSVFIDTGSWITKIIDIMNLEDLFSPKLLDNPIRWQSVR
jgi:serine/threonine protein phosphatase 1